MGCLEAEGEIGGLGATDEVSVGILSGRQRHDQDGQARPLEPPGKSLGSVWARLVFILVKDEVNPASRWVGKLVEPRGRQMRAEGAGGVAKARLPQHGEIKQAFDQDHRREPANRFPGK